MTLPLFIPIEVPVAGAEHGDHAFGFIEPLFGFGSFVMIVVLLVAAYILLRRKGVLLPRSWPTWTGRAPLPEEAARQVLADRFARGDISTEDFLERASVLNWTPGSDNLPPRRVGRY